MERKIRATLQEKLMVVATSVWTGRDTHKTVQIQLTSKAVPFALFEVFRHNFGHETVDIVYSKSTAVRVEGDNVRLTAFLRFFQHSVKFLREGLRYSTASTTKVRVVRIWIFDRRNINIRIGLAAKATTKRLQSFDTVLRGWRHGRSRCLMWHLSSKEAQGNGRSHRISLVLVLNTTAEHMQILLFESQAFILSSQYLALK
mmetsp:Transcript_72044/g.192149  ORF Transcript_72044/g.192149 Transcript_72044/m.192149 type:complete len:201 (-) Transcript_72044:367-969(-)